MAFSFSSRSTSTDWYAVGDSPAAAASVTATAPSAVDLATVSRCCSRSVRFDSKSWFWLRKPSSRVAMPSFSLATSWTGVALRGSRPGPAVAPAAARGASSLPGAALVARSSCNLERLGDPSVSSFTIGMGGSRPTPSTPSPQERRETASEHPRVRAPAFCEGPGLPARSAGRRAAPPSADASRFTVLALAPACGDTYRRRRQAWAARKGERGYLRHARHCWCRRGWWVGTYLRVRHTKLDTIDGSTVALRR